MSSVFIIHGTGGHPEENWFPWLRQKVESAGHKIFIPQFPTPEGQSFETWQQVLNGYEKEINEQTIFVAHSLGCIFLLRTLEKLPHKIKAAVFVSPPIGVEPILNYKADSAFSGGFNFDWKALRTKADNFVVFHSDNDLYVDIANGKKLAKELGVELDFIPNAGHFNAKAGYTKFDELWSKLEPTLNT